MNQPESYQSSNQVISQVLQTTLAEPPLTKACQCHFIDPNKLRVLLWKDIKPNQLTTYILKIAEQKFVGESRLDRRGETYWRFRELYETKEAQSADVLPSEKPKKLPLEIEINKPLSDYSKTEIDRQVKFLERQERAEQLAKERAAKELKSSVSLTSPTKNQTL